MNEKPRPLTVNQVRTLRLLKSLHDGNARRISLAMRLPIERIEAALAELKEAQ